MNDNKLFTPVPKDDNTSSNVKDVSYYTNILLASGLTTVALYYNHVIARQEKVTPKE